MEMISVVIPILNEEGNLRELTRRLKNVFDGLQSYAYEIILVESGSTDKSVEVIKGLAAEDSHVVGLILSRNFGHQVALCAGLDIARGQAVIMMDGDLQHPPELIPQFIDKWKSGYEIVYSVRKDSKNQSFFKRKTSKLFYFIFRKLSGLNLPFGTADFRLLGSKGLSSLRSCQERTRFLRGLIAWIGYEQAAIDYYPDKRFAGESKYSFMRLFNLAFDSTLSFSSIPLTFSTWMGMLTACLGFIYGFYALWVRLFTTEVLPGWTSTLISVLFIGGIQLLCIGIIGSYLARIYEEVKQRPLYFIKNVYGSSTTGMG